MRMEAVPFFVQRDVRVAEHDRVGVGEAFAHSLEPPGRRAGVMDHPDPDACQLHGPPLREPHLQLPAVDVSPHPVDRRTERLEVFQHLQLHEVAGVQDRVRLLEPLHARVGQPARPARQMRVRDHRDDHPALS